MSVETTFTEELHEREIGGWTQAEFAKTGYVCQLKISLAKLGVLDDRMAFPPPAIHSANREMQNEIMTMTERLISLENTELRRCIATVLEEIGDLTDMKVDAVCEQASSVSDAKRAISRPAFGMRLALEEAMANHVHHGNKADPRKTVTVRYGLEEDGTLYVQSRDEGRGFREDNLQDPTAEDRVSAPDGRGVMLMKTFMDSVEYFGNGNELRVTLNLRRIAEDIVQEVLVAQNAAQ